MVQGEGTNPQAGKVTVDEFAARVKEKYPEYKDVDNLELTNAIIEKYPEYKETVSFETPVTEPSKKKEEDTASPSLDGQSQSQEPEETSFFQPAYDAADWINKNIPVWSNWASTSTQLAGGITKAVDGLIKEAVINFMPDTPFKNSIKQQIEEKGVDKVIDTPLESISGNMSQYGEEIKNKRLNNYGVTEEEQQLGIIGNITSGNLSAAATLAIDGATDGIIQSGIAALTGVAPLAISAGGEKYYDVSNKPNYSSSERLLYSSAVGLMEGLIESVFATDIKAFGKVLDSDVALKGFEKELIAAAKNTPWYKEFLKSGTEEGFEEALSESFGQMLTGFKEGIRPDPVAIAESFIMGFLPGAGTHVITNGISAIGSEKRAKLRENLAKRIKETEAKIEEVEDPGQKAILEEMAKGDIEELNKEISLDAELYSEFSDEDVSEIQSINIEIRNLYQKVGLAVDEDQKKTYKDKIADARSRKLEIENRYSEEPVRYIRDGRLVTKAQFVEMVNNATPEDIATGQWGVENDDEVTELLLSKQPTEEAPVEQPTEEAPTEETPAEEPVTEEPAVEETEDEETTTQEVETEEVAEEEVVEETEEVVEEPVATEPVTEEKVERTPSIPLDAKIEVQDVVSRKDNEGNTRFFARYPLKDKSFDSFFEVKQEKDGTIVRVSDKSYGPAVKTLKRRLAKEVPAAKPAPVQEVDTKAIKIEEGIISDAEFRIEDLQSEIDIEKGNIKEAKDKAKEDIAAVRKSKLPKEEKAEKIEEINAELQDTIDEINGNIGIYKEDIKAFKSDIRKSNRKIEKLKTPKPVAKKAQSQIQTSAVEAKETGAVEQELELDIKLLNEDGSDKRLTESQKDDPRNITTGKMTAVYTDKGILFRTKEDTGRMKEDGGEVFIPYSKAEAIPGVNKADRGTAKYAFKIAAMEGIAEEYKGDPVEQLMSRNAKPEDLGKKGHWTAGKISEAQGRKMAKSIENFNKILKKLGAAPVEFVILGDLDMKSYMALQGTPDLGKSRGSWSPVQRRITINLDLAFESTLPHELLHAYLSVVKFDKRKISEFTNIIEAELLKGSPEEIALANRLSAFRKAYIDQQVYGPGRTKDDVNIAEEFLAEYVGAIASESSGMTPANNISLVDKIKAAVIKFLAKLNIVDKSLVSKIKSREEALDFINGFINTLQGRVELDRTQPITNDPIEISSSDVKQSKKQIVTEGTYIKKSDLVDVKKLFSDFRKENGREPKVWIWMSDQLKRGQYKNEKTGVSTILEGGVGFAYDQKNKAKNVAWASGLSLKTLNERVEKADFIWFMAGSEKSSFNFSKGTTKTIIAEIEAGMSKLKGTSYRGIEIKKGNYSEFAKIGLEILKEDKTKKWSEVKKALNKGADVVDHPLRAKIAGSLLNAGTTAKMNLEIHQFLHETLGVPKLNEYHELIRDEFLKKNNYANGDMSLIIKPTGVKADANVHDTYPHAILGDVVGMPNKKNYVLDVVPEESKTVISKATGLPIENAGTPVMIKTAVGDVGAFYEGKDLDVKQQIDFAGIEMKTKETPGNTEPIIKTGGTAYVPVSTLYNLMDMRDGDRGGLYETAEDKKRVRELVKAFKKEGFEYKGSDHIYIDIDAEGYGWMGEGNHRVLAARELGMSHLPVRVEFGAARNGVSKYANNYSRVPTRVISKEKINDLKEEAEPYYHIKYASIWNTDLPTNPEPSEDVARQQISESDIEMLKDPRYVGHASPNKFDKFDPKRMIGGYRSRYGNGIYFSSVIWKIQDYGSNIKFIDVTKLNLLPGNTKVTEGFINKIKGLRDAAVSKSLKSKLKGIVVAAKESSTVLDIEKELSYELGDSSNEIIEMFEALGYDGISIKGMDDPNYEVVVFRASKANEVLVDPTAKQQIDWQPSLFGRGQVNPAIVNRTTEVQEAASELLQGKITNAEYQETVRITQPIEAITNFFLPASTKDMKDSLDKNKAKLLNTPLEDGKEIGLRLDIPAYKNRNIWVVSIHGKGASGKSLSYGSVAWATDVKFGSNPKVASFIAAGKNMDTLKKQDKTTIARMLGKWKNFEGKTKEERDATAVKKVEEIVKIENSYPGAGRKGSPWRQVGMNPFRHSFFYDRRNGKPIVSAAEVVQIGGLVYAKDVVYADKNDPIFNVDGYKDANGETVRFQIEDQANEEANNEQTYDAVENNSQGLFDADVDAAVDADVSEMDSWQERPRTMFERFIDLTRLKIQDKFRKIIAVQEDIEFSKGAPVGLDEDFRNAEALMHGKAKEELNKTEIIVGKIAKLIKNSGLSVEKFNDLLYAMHAQERNRYLRVISTDIGKSLMSIRKKKGMKPSEVAELLGISTEDYKDIEANKTALKTSDLTDVLLIYGTTPSRFFYDNAKVKDGSGMTDVEARKILAEYGLDLASPDVSQLEARIAKAVQAVRDLTADTRNRLLESGLETQATIDAFTATYKNYVPLRGFADGELQSEMIEGGRRLEVRGREKRAKGRTTKADSPLTQVIISNTTTIVRAEKNSVMNRFYNLAVSNPNKDVYEVVDPKVTKEYKREIRNGKIVTTAKTIADYMSDPNMVSIRVGGEYKFIRFKDASLADALKGANVVKAEWMTKYLGAFNRALSSFITTYDPEFVLRNFSRDIQTAVLNLFAEQEMTEGLIKDKSIVAKVVKDVLPAIKSIAIVEGGKSSKNKEMDQYYRDFKEDGAKTEWFYSKSSTEVEKDIKNLIEGKGETALQAAGNLVERINSAVENGVRLSAYVNARKAGVSRAKSAELAKNLTVNFNKSGEWGQIGNTLFLFFNASVQGTSRLMRTLKPQYKVDSEGNRSLHINTAQKMAIGLSLMGSIMSIINEIGSDDDEDDKSFYSKIPDFEKERNIIIMKPNGKGYWKIPLPYGVNVFYVTGTLLADAAQKIKTPGEVAGGIIQAALGSFSPINFPNSDDTSKFLVKFVMPTIGQVPLALAINENYFGQTIYNENFPFDTSPKPESELGRKGGNRWTKELTRLLNKISGGSEFRGGEIDINPDKIDFVMESYSGGMGKFVSRSANTIDKIITGNWDQIEPRQVPFLRVFYGQSPKYANVQEFYSRSILVNQMQEEVKAGIISGAEANRVSKVFYLGKNIRKQLSALKEREDAAMQIKDPDLQKEKMKKLEELRYKLVADYNKQYEKFKIDKLK